MRLTPSAFATGTATHAVIVYNVSVRNQTSARFLYTTLFRSNYAPTLDPISNLTITENAGQQTVNLTGISSGASNQVQTLIVTATSSNPGLVLDPTDNYTTPN